MVVSKLLLLAAVAAAQPAFEVASVRPSAPIVDGASVHGSRKLDPNQFTATNVTLLELVLRAYRITSCGNAAQYGCAAVLGGPDWMRKDQFDVRAKIAEGTPAHDLQQLVNGHAPELSRMLEGLLADRFHFNAHRETREMPIYALKVSKKGHKLGQPEESSAESHLLVSPFEADGQRSFRFEALNTSMKELADFFSGCMSHPMIDQTGLNGKFHLKITYDANPLASGDFTELAGPELFRALDDQLGLKVEASKGRNEVLVIDHAERPTAN